MSGEGTYVCKLDPETLEKAKNELNEDPKQRASQIQSLRDWLKSQPHIRSRTDDVFLLRFLRAAKFSQLRAQQVIENYWTARSVPGKGAPDWFENLSPKDPRIQEVLDLGVAVPLPGKDDEGRQVVLIRTGAYDPKEYNVADILRVAFINNDVMLLDEDNQVHGFQTILDFTGFSSGHVWYYTRENLQKAMRCWQMIVHRSNLESLHQKVPKRLLPTHLGGDAGSIEDIAKNWKDHVIKFQGEFDLNKLYGIDEDKMPRSEKKDGWGITGAFRKLSVE